MRLPILISVIIPARDEQETLGRTIRSVREQVPGPLLAEVIVVDHGSRDRTKEVAQSVGAVVLDGTGHSLGGLRNLGARTARGSVLLFLDADVTLGPEWNRGLPDLLGAIEAHPRLVTGSWPGAPERSGWIAEAWTQEHVKHGPVSHLGSGHMVITRAAFEEVGGFDESLHTGEDFDICARARAAGAQILAIRTLQAVHHGEPATLNEFFRRELWHGVGDAQGFRHWFRSYIAMTASVFAVFHVLAVASIVIRQPPIGLWTGVTGLGGILAIMAAAVVRRRDGVSWRTLGSFLVLTYVYLWARFLALFRGMGDSDPESPRHRARRSSPSP